MRCDKMKMDFLNSKYENTTREKYSTQVWKNTTRKKRKKARALDRTEGQSYTSLSFSDVAVYLTKIQTEKKNDSTKVEEKGFCPNFLIIFSNFHRVFSDCMLENVLTRKFRPSVLKTCLITTFKSVYLSDW